MLQVFDTIITMKVHTCVTLVTMPMQGCVDKDEVRPTEDSVCASPMMHAPPPAFPGQDIFAGQSF
jgi:hypothetical protein